MRVFFAVLTSLATIFSPQLSSQVQTYVSNTSTIHTVAEQADATREHDIVEARAQEQKLPEDIADSISNGDTVVSSEYVAKDDGTLVYAQTGEKVTDPKIVGTQEEVPDPLARTNGESFIPVSVEAAREIIDDADTSEEEIPQQEDTPQNPDRENSAQQDDPTQLQASSAAYIASAPSVRSVGNWSSNYGAKWGSYNGQQAFFEGDGSLFVVPASKVIDVSEWQGDINWDAVKADGVQGAIIRIGYGTDATDKKALRNLREVQRVGLPFGVYLYSYASNWSEAWAEGSNVVSILKKAGITSSEQMSMPIFYDLENWTYAGHKHPTSPAVYDTIVNNFFMSVQLSGYGKVSVYSYTSFLKSVLNTSNIHSRTSWVASYGSSPRFVINSYEKGWQYTSTGSVNGISGNVDLNAYRFNVQNTSNLNGTKPKTSPSSSAFQASSLTKVTVPDGEYYINSSMLDVASIDTYNQSLNQNNSIVLHRYAHAKSQKYRFVKQSDGSYTIINSASGLALDVQSGQARNNARVILWSPNGGNNQRWFIRDAGNGYIIQSALGNFVLDVQSAGKSDNTPIILYEPGHSNMNQRFILSSTRALPTGLDVTIRSVLNGNMTVSAASGKATLGAQLKLGNYKSSADQKYKLFEVGNGIYTIQNSSTGYVVDIYGASRAVSTPVDLYANKSSAWQRWAAIFNANNQVAFSSVLSAKNIEVYGGRAYQDTSIRTADPSFASHQFWAVYPENQDVIPNGIYSIQNNTHRNITLDVYGAFKNDATAVDVYTARNGSKNQQWRVVNQKNGYIKLFDVNSGKPLDVYGEFSRAGTDTIIYSDRQDARNQLWKPVKQANGSFTIESALSSSLVLDIYGGHVQSGTKVIVYTKAPYAGNQQWYFKRIS
ncbi:RICIN domain-containing protein [Alloscardovia omnicolens]